MPGKFKRMNFDSAFSDDDMDEKKSKSYLRRLRRGADSDDEMPVRSVSIPSPESKDSGYSSQELEKPMLIEELVELEDVEIEVPRLKDSKKASKKKEKKEKNQKTSKPKTSKEYQQNMRSVALGGAKERENRVLLEILQQRLSTQFAIPLHSFKNLIRDIFRSHHPQMKIRMSAIEALQLEAEMMLTKMFRLSRFGTEHANRQTLMLQDIRLVQTILETNKDGVSFLT